MTSSIKLQPYQPNPILAAVYRKLFDKIELEPGWVESVRALAEQGTVVYVLRNLNWVDYFALDFLTKKHNLPRILYVGDIGLWVLSPMGKGWLNAIVPASNLSPAEELTAALEQGSAAVFLKRPPTVLDIAQGASGGRGMRGKGEALVETLLENQRSTERPIFFVPLVFLWSRHPDTRGKHFFDAFLGPREWPSPVRSLSQMLLTKQGGMLKSGEPVNLKEFLSSADEEQAPSPEHDEHLIRRLTYLVIKRLERERRAVTGPVWRSSERVRQEILRNQRFLKDIKRVAKTPEAEAEALVSAEVMLRELQAQPELSMVEFFGVALKRLFTKIYGGLEIDQVGIERLRELNKRAAIVLLPSHKSHIDYLLLSYIFHQSKLPVPLIAAGDNLKFFPMGPLFRRAGAFFIRRSFRGDAVYPFVVDAYIRRIMRDGYPIEVFLEGGRSRTGKLLEPKLGLLTMIVNAALGQEKREVLFVPVSIGYERIVETESFQHELRGGEKVREDAAGLLGATEVLRHRYGRIGVQFGKELSLTELRKDLGYNYPGELKNPHRRALITVLGNQAMDEINRISLVSAGSVTALSMMSYWRRGLSHEKLIERSEKFLKICQEFNSPISPSLLDSEGNMRAEGIREAAQMFVDAELVQAHSPAVAASPKRRSKGYAGPGMIYTLPQERRLELDTSKNMLLHVFAVRGIIASIMVSLGGRAERSVIVEHYLELKHWYQHEFRFPALRSEEDQFSADLEVMLTANELQLNEEEQVVYGPGRLDWSGEKWISNYAQIFRNFLESYLIMIRTIPSLLEGSMTEKDLSKRALAVGTQMYLRGEVERNEAINKATFANALLSLRAKGAIKTEGKGLMLTESFNNARALQSLEDDFKKYLDREVTQG